MAKASIIDLDGSLFVFTDIANGCIYTKQILLDGSAELKTYILKPTENKVNVEYVSKQQFENVVNELKQRIKELKEGTAYVSEVEQTNDAEYECTCFTACRLLLHNTE